MEQIGNESVLKGEEGVRESEKEAKIETLSLCTEIYDLHVSVDYLFCCNAGGHVCNKFSHLPNTSLIQQTFIRFIRICVSNVQVFENSDCKT